MKTQSLFSALSDGTRFRLLALLAAGPMSVSAMTCTLKIPQAGVSHHLMLLRVNGLVVSERNGRAVEYRISDAVKLKGRDATFALDDGDVVTISFSGAAKRKAKPAAKKKAKIKAKSKTVVDAPAESAAAETVAA